MASAFACPMKRPVNGSTRRIRGWKSRCSMTGMEKYKDIKEWQHHGSVYGIVAAKTGYLKPTGEWNREEIIANGRHITVILNGETIVDADLDKVSEKGTIDGKVHPGLKREKGHICFCGHGAEVWFRNLRIKELK